MAVLWRSCSQEPKAPPRRLLLIFSLLNIVCHHQSGGPQCRVFVMVCRISEGLLYFWDSISKIMRDVNSWFAALLRLAHVRYP